MIKPELVKYSKPDFIIKEGVFEKLILTALLLSALIHIFTVPTNAQSVLTCDLDGCNDTSAITATEKAYQRPRIIMSQSRLQRQLAQIEEG